jgi:hypothetical protein
MPRKEIGGVNRGYRKLAPSIRPDVPKLKRGSITQQTRGGAISVLEPLSIPCGHSELQGRQGSGRTCS